MNRILSAAVVATCLLPSQCLAENWPVWRGPEQNGISLEKELPTEWSRTANVVWRVPLPGVAPSTPVIWQDKVFVTSTVRDSEDVLLLCVDTAGLTIWQRVVGRGSSEQADKNNLAAPSPSTDGRYVWTFTGNGTLACHDFSGELQWQFNVEDRYEKIDMPWGLASSPVPDGDLLFLQLFHLNSSRVVAVDKFSGSEAWTNVRQTEAKGKCMRSYATPVVCRNDERAYLLTQGQDYLVAHDLKDGHELWRWGDFHPRTGYDPTMHVSSSPVVNAGIILVPSGDSGNFQALHGDREKPISGSAPQRLWSSYISPKRPSALLVDSLAYICQETGVLHCLDAATGNEHYKRAAHRHTHYASPVYADGKIYLASHDGTVTVVQAGPQFKILAKNSLDEPISASPAISGGRIYLRTFQAPYAIGGS